MQNQSIVDYIKQSRSAGLDDQMIRQNLLSSGWTAADIDQAFTGNTQSTSNPYAISYIPPVSKKSSLFKILGIIFVIFVIIGAAGMLVVRAAKKKVIENQKLAPQIQQSFDKRDYANAVTLIDQVLGKAEPSESNLLFFALKGQAQQELGKAEEAKQSYESLMPIIDKLNNTEQRKYDFVFFGLGRIYLQQKNFASAENYYKRGLVVNSGDSSASLELGQVYESSGQREKAIAHFQGIQKSFTNSETLFIAAYKLNQLQNITQSGNTFSQNEIYELFPVRIYPAESNLQGISPEEICSVLKIRFLQNCAVMPKLQVDYSKIGKLETGNWDSQEFVSQLMNLIPENERKSYVTLVLTSEDIGNKDAKFLFSFQDYDVDMAIVSIKAISRFIPQMAEQNLILSRRVALQSISSTGQILGYARDEYPNCPLAYVNGYDEFTNRKTQLCQSTLKDQTAWLQANPNFKHAITPQESSELSRIYEKYYLDKF